MFFFCAKGKYIDNDTFTQVTNETDTNLHNAFKSVKSVDLKTNYVNKDIAVNFYLNII